jgi:PAS domain S-box-containing protein
MTNLLQKLLKNLKSQVDSDLTCLIKFDQNTFKLLFIELNENESFDFQSIVKVDDQLDYSNIQKSIISMYNYSSHIQNNFIVGNNQYFILSLSKNIDNFTDIKHKIHLETTESIKELTILIEESSKKVISKPDLFRFFAEVSSELVFTLDPSGAFTYLNEYGIKQLKYNSDEILGQHIFELITERYKSKVGEAFQKIISEKCEISFNSEIIPKVNFEQLYNIRLVPIYINGELNQLLGVGTNLSDQNTKKKKNEELLAKLTEANRINSIEKDRAKQQISILSELNNLKNEFISNVSHELRTPLASIIGFSETILDDKKLTVDRAKEFSDVILTESKRLAKLINDVLDFSELENEKQHLEKNSINIIDILSDCVEGYKKESSHNKITLTSKIPESEIIIFADKDRLKKAFNYLLSNAFKFTNENGRITLIAQEFLKEVEIVISDTGIGISDQKLPFLFDKFNKVKRATNNLPGTGFGLVTVKQIIDLHKGLIRVKSEVDKGTSFIIRLPKYSFN